MKKISALEFRRQLWHLFFGLVFVFLIHFDVIDLLRMTVILVSISIILAVYKFYKIIVIHEIMMAFEREKNFEVFPGFGSVFFLLGITLALWLFPKDIAVASILVLTMGDSIAPLVGHMGTHKYLHNKKKTWEGLIAGMVASILATVLIVPLAEAVLGSIVAMLAEGLDITIKGNKIDDNLILPLVSGGVMLGIRTLSTVI